LVISGFENNEIGTLKFSTNGNKLVSVHAFVNDVVELMDFDNTTGIISNPILFKPNASPPPPSFPGVYGAEFSPNSQLLYVSANNSLTEPSVLYQFDITSNNPATILASKRTISINAPWYAGALQLGPDLKIYMAMWKDTSVSVIENPDVYGAGCNFSFNKIYMGPLNSEPVQFGLPTFIQSYFDTSSNPYDFTRSGNCLDLNVTFKINRLTGIDSVKWDFGDGQQSQLIQPTHSYGAGGFYDVSLIVYKIDCSGLFDTIIRRIWIADKPDFLGADTSSCTALSVNLGIDEIFGVNYLWSTGYTGNQITTTGFGSYWLELEQNGCKIRDTMYVTQRPEPFVNLGPDTSVCLYKPIELRTGNIIADSYEWNTGESTATISVNKKGIYYVTIKEGDCVSSDTVLVSAGDCDVYIPSAFTPNDDGLNETFGVITDVSVQSFSMQIYSKWGQLIFSSNDISKKWDGTFKGKKMPNGAYLWILNYVNLKGKKINEHGTVMLIR
jgi:gliding motility-associated-like protein